MYNIQKKEKKKRKKNNDLETVFRHRKVSRQPNVAWKFCHSGVISGE